jgi:hypothetical protein
MHPTIYGMSHYYYYLKTKICVGTFDTRQDLWRRIQQISGEIKSTPEIFDRLRVSFSRAAELCVREHGGNFQYLSKKVKIMTLLTVLLFVFFLYPTR